METVETGIDRPSVKVREKFFEQLYEVAFPVFAEFAAKQNASFEDARDIFHDALVIYYEKSSDPSFIVNINAEAYVFGIARHLWIRKVKQDKRKVSLSTGEEGIFLQTDELPGDRDARLLNLLERAGKRCMDLLQQFYFERSTLKEIAARCGYKTVHTAAVQKFKCLAKIRDVIRAKSIRYEDFNF